MCHHHKSSTASSSSSRCCVVMCRQEDEVEVAAGRPVRLLQRLRLNPTLTMAASSSSSQRRATSADTRTAAVGSASNTIFSDTRPRSTADNQGGHEVVQQLHPAQKTTVTGMPCGSYEATAYSYSHATRRVPCNRRCQGDVRCSTAPAWSGMCTAADRDKLNIRSSTSAV